ncbi:LysR family transcriptional regulator [Cryobacterium arcticum]|uniref:LysR family transcriptional regulator n=1 Tax=Cryobacterium arcticum TaxID=670052 RepID=A0A1B1BKS2_9MICO|nr:LysR family transcriptional regulator [Cryobacterium arcticum]ANP73185.1 LysR family transcriptional regulator [Cryobacterium arcticum]
MADTVHRALDVDSHALRIVHRINELGSITAAARSLGYSQPAVSQHLKRLEARLGLPLVAKSGRGVRLTEAGRILARHAATVTQALDAAAGELSDLAGLRSGRVTLAAFPSASATVIPTLLRGLSQRHPGVQLSYLEAEPPEAVRAVRDRAADLAITFSYTGDQADPHRQSAQGLTVAPLWRDEMLVVLPREHPLAGHSRIDLARLAEDQWIGGCPRCRAHLLDLAARSGFTPGISYETDNVVAVFGMVAAGLGVALVPALAIAASPLPTGIVARPTTAGDFRTIHLVGAEGSESVPAVAATIRAIGEIDAAPWSLFGAGSGPHSAHAGAGHPR